MNVAKQSKSKSPNSLAITKLYFIPASFNEGYKSEYTAVPGNCFSVL